jgi:hypothetical protein
MGNPPKIKAMKTAREREFVAPEVVEKTRAEDGPKLSVSESPAPKTPLTKIRQALKKVYGKLIDKLESSGLTILTQTQEEAIEEAAKARAKVTGESIEDVRRSLMESVKNARRLWTGKQTVNDALVPETEEYADSTTGDLAYVPEAKGVNAGPVRVVAGLAFGRHRGFGMEHMADNATHDSHRRPEQQTGDLAEDLLRQAVAVLEGVSQVHKDGDSVVLVNPKQRMAVITEWRNDHYSVISVRPYQGSAESLWGVPDRIGRLTFPTRDAATTPPSTTDAKAGLSRQDRTGLEIKSEKFKLSADEQKTQPTITVKKRRRIDIKFSTNGHIEGFYDPVSGKSFLIADAMTEETAPGTLMHEVGLHMAADKDSGIQQLVDRAGELRKKWKGISFVKQAESRMEEAGETSNEEFLAYTATEYENNRARMPKSLAQLVKDLIATVKAWLHRRGWLDTRSLTVADFAAIVRANAKRMANNAASAEVVNADLRRQGTNDIRFSRRQSGRAGLSADTPVLFGLRDTESLRENAGYRSAKNGGLDAAWNLVREVMKPRIIEQAKAKFGEDVVYVPIRSVRDAGKNQIPSELAAYLAEKTGATMGAGIYKTAKTGHTGESAMGRMLRQSEFSGEIEAGKRYVIVDDVIAMGGTIADLGAYIEQNGGEVAGVVSLVNTRGMRNLAATPEQLARIREKFGNEIERLFGLKPEQLTRPEATFISRFSSLEALQERVTQEQTRLDQQREQQEAARAAREEAKAKQNPKRENAAPRDNDPMESAGELGDRINSLRDKAMDSLRNARDNWKEGAPKWLAVITLRQLSEYAGNLVPQVRDLVRGMQAMQTERNKMADQAARLAERWQKLERTAADALGHMMGEATTAGVDPSEAYAAVVDIEAARERIDQIKRLMAGAPGTVGKIRETWVEEIKQLQMKIGQEQNREKAHDELQEQWSALSDEAKAIYKEARDAYQRMSERQEQAIIDRIEQADFDQRWKAAAIAKVRQEFTAARVAGPYFPLHRNGNYYVKARRKTGESVDKKTGKVIDNYEYGFFMYDTVSERRKDLSGLKAQGWEIERMGLKDDAQKQMDQVSEEFITNAVEQIQAQVEGPAGKAAADAVYQEFLKAMPYLSHRVHFIHRKKTPGWSQDALRAFAFNMAHQATQIARMEQAPMMQRALREAREMIAKNAEKTDDKDTVKQEAILYEAQRRLEWMMNPTGNKLASTATTLGFVWYLGASPAAGLVNLSQTAIVAFPELASRFGVAGAFKQLLKAGKQTFAARKNWKERGNYNQWDGLSDDEKSAFRHWVNAGVIDNTEAYMLMGMSDTDSSTYNPNAAKALKIVGTMFQEAEVINREATLLAAYRLAREQGMTHARAMEAAQDATWASHFDYSNANRARLMQGNFAKVFLLFRSYSQHMTWYLARNFQQAIKGETPAVRKAARTRFVGVLGMTGLFAGSLGMPMASVLFGIVNMMHDLFDDDDEPWDAQTEFRNALADLGFFGAAIDRGLITVLTGQNWASRVDLSQLWIRDPDRDLEGKALYTHYLEQAAGPVFGIGALGLRAAQLWGDGEYQRAIEAGTPKALKDALKAMRYATEGVQNMKGDPIVSDKDLSPFDAVWQAIGFSPERVAAQYAANTQAKNYEEYILTRRRRLMAAYATAVTAKDTEARLTAMEKIRAFNKTNPRVKIDYPALRQSIKTRQRYREQADAGIHLNKNLRYLRDETRVPM